MYKILIHVNLSKESLYCLLIQFSPIKSIKQSNYFIVEYFNKKDMKYSLEMLSEVKINNKYIKYKVLEDKCVYLKSDYIEIFEKFNCKILGDKVRFENEEKLREVLEIIDNEYVDYKKLRYNILHFK